MAASGDRRGEIACELTAQDPVAGAWISPWVDRLLAMVDSNETALGAFFEPNGRLDDRRRRYWKYSIAALYVIGLIHWSFFFDLGQLKFNVHDWGLTAHYLLGLEQAVTTGQLPLHVTPETPFHQTERFLTNPDLPVSPQVVLIPLLGLGRFVWLNTLLLYSLGFVGLYLLAKKLELSSFSFAMLFALFSFNGHVTSHLGVGHIVWLGYLLMPFVVLLIFVVAERGPDRRWPVLMALALFAILLQGAFHFVIWSALLLVLLALTQPSLRRSAIVAVILTIALGAFRFVPAAFEFPSPEFLAGFQSVGDILTGLSSLMTPIEAANEHYGQPEWWEVDFYVGILGLGFLAVFGVFSWLRPGNNQDLKSVRVLAPALIVMTLLSLDIIFRAIANLPIPFIGAERVSSRFFVLPFLFLIVFSVMALQRWLNSRRQSVGIRMLLIAGLFATALDLWQHSRVWRPSAAQLGFELIYPNLLVSIENRLDPAYVNALIAGAAITLIALAYSVWRLLRYPKGTPTSTEVADQESASGSQGVEQ